MRMKFTPSCFRRYRKEKPLADTGATPHIRRAKPRKLDCISVPLTAPDHYCAQLNKERLCLSSLFTDYDRFNVGEITEAGLERALGGACLLPPEHVFRAIVKKFRDENRRNSGKEVNYRAFLAAVGTIPEVCETEGSGFCSFFPVLGGSLSLKRTGKPPRSGTIVGDEHDARSARSRGESHKKDEVDTVSSQPWITHKLRCDTRLFHLKNTSSFYVREVFGKVLHLSSDKVIRPCCTAIFRTWVRISAQSHFCPYLRLDSLNRTPFQGMECDVVPRKSATENIPFPGVNIQT